MEVARRIELSRNRASAAARAMFPQSRHPVSRRRGWDLVPLRSPRSPASPCPAPSYWMSRRADRGLAVVSRLSRGRSDPAFAPRFACLHLVSAARSLQDWGLRGSWHFFSDPRGLYRTVWGGVALNGEALAWAFSASPGRVTPRASGTLGPRWR